MSILNLRPARTERQERVEPSPPIPYAPKPKPVPPGPRQLGSMILQSAREITEQAAAQMETVATKLEEAAHETAEGYREAARRMRRTGELADLDMANFVQVAVTCDDAAAYMNEAITRRHEPQPEPLFNTEAEPAAEGATPLPVNLDAIEKKIAETASDAEI